MNEEKNINTYKWELAGFNEVTQERIAFPCSANSVGTIINQIVNEDAEGLWDVPQGVRNDLRKVIAAGIIDLDLVSKIVKVDRKEINTFLNDSTYELKLCSDNVFMLMELTKNLYSAIE